MQIIVKTFERINAEALRGRAQSFIALFMRQQNFILASFYRRLD